VPITGSHLGSQNPTDLPPAAVSGAWRGTLASLERELVIARPAAFRLSPGAPAIVAPMPVPAAILGLTLPGPCSHLVTLYGRGDPDSRSRTFPPGAVSIA
jgi:hypothetical protein